MTSSNAARMSLRVVWTVLLGFALSSTLVTAAERPAVPAGATSDSSWTEPQNVSASPSADSEAAALAVTGIGTAHLVWEEGDELYHSYRTGNVWSEPERIGGTGNGEQPALAAGPGDTVHLVYVNYTDSFNVFYVSWDGSGWGIPQNVSGTASVSDSPDVAVGSDGSVHIVATESAAKQLYYGQTDGTYVPVNHSLGFAYGEGASIDVFGADTIQLTYGDAGEIYAMERSGTSWSSPESVSNSLDANSTAPDLATDGSGTMHVVWQEEVDGIPQVLYAQGDVWDPILTLSSSASGARLPAVATAGQQQHVLWHDAGMPSAIRHAYRLTNTGPWTTGTVYTSTTSLTEAAIVSGVDGVLHAAWTEGAPGEILYARGVPYRVFLPLVLANAG